MTPRSVPLVTAAMLLVAACTVMPSGPSVVALPGSNKTLAQFVEDDHNCRQFALGQVGGVGSHPASGAAAANSSAVSTGYSGGSGDSAQHLYDVAYIQCMYASGHRVPVYGPTLAAPPATPPADYKPTSPPPGPQGNTR
ncbi:glycine zipper family protein [Cupriavidus sp. WKF15]|uniref:glycine zipper family protein n=1 Tax=Cupriavidus sp. WKF15 TaxID=3032282 RepID=UPI0023E27A95|nr:glycine zipper family protein [Cupriavidus sp. WKF15]WER49165.1 glycine zipper family protein [Cupriavidus sp. WKF15]